MQRPDRSNQERDQDWFYGRTEWTPEQVTPTEPGVYADQRAHDVAWMSAKERVALDEQQARLAARIYSAGRSR